MRKCTLPSFLQHVRISRSFQPPSPYELVPWSAVLSGALMSDAAGLRPAGDASARSCVEPSPIPSLSLTAAPATAPCGLDSVFCPSAVPPLTPTALVRNLPCWVTTVPSHDCYSFLCGDDCPSATSHDWVVFHGKCYPADHLGKIILFLAFHFSAVLFFLFDFWQQWRMGYIKTAC